MRVHLSRFVCRDVASNLARMEEEAAHAARSGAELCVFPESFLHGYSRQVEPALVRETFARISAEHARTTYVFGSFTEERRNRMTVWRGGLERASYDKVHLFAPNGEGELWDPGDRYVTYHANPWTLGLLNCNDLRFPEQARALRLEGGADLLVVVAWWPWRRTHIFEALLRARAIENGCFALGCCISASEHPGEVFAGAGNYAFDPLGEALRSYDDATYLLDRCRLGDVMVDPVACFMDIQDIERR